MEGGHGGRKLGLWEHTLEGSVETPTSLLIAFLAPMRWAAWLGSVIPAVLFCFDTDPEVIKQAWTKTSETEPK